MPSSCYGFDQEDDEPKEEKRQVTGGAGRPLDGHAPEVGAMTLTPPALVAGSELVTVDTDQAGDWQRALATVGGRPPVGWDQAGERSGGVVGYDLVLAAPAP